MKKILSCILLSLAVLTAGAEALSLDEAIAFSAEKTAEALPDGTRVAVLNCASSSSKLSDYIIQEVILSLLNSRRLVVVERADIQLVKEELQFQLSGDVSDESAQSIGKMLGAQVIVSCSLDDTLNFRIKAIAVETAQLLSAASVKILVTEKLESLSENLVLVLDCEAGDGDAALASTVGAIMLSAVSGSTGFRAVSPESRGKALGGTPAGTADITDTHTRKRIGAITGADSLLTARLSTGQGLWYLTVTHVSVENGTVLSSSTETYRSEGTVLEGSHGQILRCLGVQEARDDRRVITVTNTTELLQAIGSDRIIRLAAGNYDLTRGFQTKNRNIAWLDEYDGPCPVIKSVSNLALIGEGKVTVMIKPAYGWVFSFETCTGIRITNIVFGHTVPGYCLGGVLRFKNCDDTEIRSCEMYGSGTYGLSLERTSRFAMEDCVIHDCTYGLAVIEGSSDISFANTVFRDTGEFDLVSIEASDHVLWTDCRFEGNWGNSLFSVDDESRDIRLTDCGFSRNMVDAFCENDQALTVEGAAFASNEFEPYGD
jgi:hypothetical protein